MISLLALISALPEQVSAWEEPPKKQLALKPTDLTARLNKKWLQLYWPDDGKWWPCQVATVDVRKKTVTLIYETGAAILPCCLYTSLCKHSQTFTPSANFDGDLYVAASSLGHFLLAMAGFDGMTTAESLDQRALQNWISTNTEYALSTPR